MSAVRKVIFLLSLTLAMGAWGRFATLEGAPATPAIPAEGVRIDIYGNPIEAAAGDYRLDIRGDLYENHSPDTAILALGSPGV